MGSLSQTKQLDIMADRPSSKFLQDFECWDKNTRKVYWDNRLDMKNAVDKTIEVNGRSREFYRIAWIEDDDEENEVEEVINDAEKIEAFKIENIRNGHLRKRWKVQHFSEFKNDKVKRDQCRKFIRSRELIVPTEKLVMKPFLRKNQNKKAMEEMDDNNNYKNYKTEDSKPPSHEEAADYFDNFNMDILKLESLKLEENDCNKKPLKKRVRFSWW